MIGTLVFLHSFPPPPPPLPSSFPFPFLLSPFNPLELSNRRNLHLNLSSPLVNAPRRRRPSVGHLTSNSFRYVFDLDQPNFKEKLEL